MRFNAAVMQAVRGVGSGWSVSGTPTRDTEAGKPGPYRISCRYLISAVGQLHTAYMPDIPGLKDIGGNYAYRQLGKTGG